MARWCRSLHSMALLLQLSNLHFGSWEDCVHYGLSGLLLVSRWNRRRSSHRYRLLVQMMKSSMILLRLLLWWRDQSEIVEFRFWNLVFHLVMLRYSCRGCQTSIISLSLIASGHLASVTPYAFTQRIWLVTCDYSYCFELLNCENYNLVCEDYLWSLALCTRSSVCCFLRMISRTLIVFLWCLR